MGVKNKEEILSQISALLSENNSDEAIAFIEDISDTIDDYEIKVKGDGVDWKSKYNELDNSWREKYKARFTNPTENIESKEEEKYEEDTTDDNEQKSMNYEDLFEEKKEDK